MSSSSKSFLSGLGIAGLSLLAGACGDGGEEGHQCAPGEACLWAGIEEPGFNKDTPKAHRLESKLYSPEDVTFGPDGLAYVVDWNNHRIRRVDSEDRLITIMGTDYEGDGPPEMEDRIGACNPGGPVGAVGTTVAMNHMTDVEFGPDGRMYVAAWHNNKIRIWDPATGKTTAFGDGYGYAGDDNLVCAALFNQPKSIAIAPDGTLYTIDQRNVRIREITPDPATGGPGPGPASMIRTIAGTGTVGNIGDGGQALDAQFGFEIGTTPRPTGGLVLDGRTLYVADSLNHRIRRINLDTGIVDCIAGVGTPGYSGDGGDALKAQLNFPSDIELGADGKMYVADRLNHAIRAIDMATGTIETVVGTGAECRVTRDGCPAGVPAREVGLWEPYGIGLDPAGNLYVADTHNHRILKVTR